MNENPKTATSKLLEPALVLSRVAAQPHGLITALLLIEIAQTYNVPVGVAGQLSSTVSIVSVFMGLLMSLLAIKYSYKSLMLVGLTFYLAAFISSYLAPDFAILLITFSLIGVATSMVNPMASALVGTLLSPDRRAKIIGWFFAGMALCVLFGSPYITYITGTLGWRANFLLFALPFASAALILVYVGIPGTKTTGSDQSRGSIIHSFREIFVNRSAVSCIVCSMLTEAAMTVTPVFGITYMRQITQLPLSFSWLILVGTSSCFMVGSLSGSRLVERLGRQRLVVLSSFIMGVLTLAYLNVSEPLISVVLLFIVCVVSSMRYTASESLTLEQVPALRGTVMSLNSIALSVGVTIGTGLGGYLLIFYSYGGLGLLGLFSVLAAAIYIYSVNDPFRSLNVESVSSG